jgi:hypothetical protein
MEERKMKLKLIKGVFLLFWGIILLIQCASCKSGLQKTKVAKTSEANNAQISSNDTTAKFDFETGTQEWKSQNWKDFRGNYGVEQTTAYSKSGHYALLLDCDSTKNSKGEAFVDLRKDFNAPLNLERKTIKCWILIPSSDAVGDPHHPNGVQLFVKSIKNEGTSNEQLFSEYGTCYDLPGRTGFWFEITLKPSIETPKRGYSKQGFDPKKIVVIGIKIVIGKGSSSSFKGSLFIDDIDW